jgi:hypothetical protein
MVSGKPYISVNSAITKAANAPKARQSRTVLGWVNENTKMTSTSEFITTRDQRP